MSCKSDWRWEAKCSSPDCCKGGRKRRRKSRRKRRRTRRKQRKHGGNGLKIIEKYKRTPAAAGNPTKRLPQGLRAPRWRPGELASHTLISPNTNRTTIRRSRRPPPPPPPSARRQRKRREEREKLERARERVGRSKHGFTLDTKQGALAAEEAAKRFQRGQIARERAAAAQLDEELRPLREAWEDEERARRAAARRGSSSRTSRTVSTTSNRSSPDSVADLWGAWGSAALAAAAANSDDEPYPGHDDRRRGPGMKFTKGGRRTRRRKRRGGEFANNVRGHNVSTFNRALAEKEYGKAKTPIKRDLITPERKKKYDQHIAKLKPKDWRNLWGLFGGGRRRTRKQRGGEIQKLTATDMMRNSTTILGHKINEIIDDVNELTKLPPPKVKSATKTSGGRRKTRRNRRRRRKKSRKFVR